MIICEGPDGGGKSTLAENLAKDLGIPLRPKAMSSDWQPLKDMKQYIEEMVNQGFSTEVFDRFALISGPLYAPIINDGYQLNIYSNFDWMQTMHYRFYGILNPVMIYCIPPMHVVRDNVRRGTDNEKPAPYIERIYQAYVARAALDFGTRRFLFFDYTEDDYTVLLDKVEHHLAMERKHR